MTLFTRPNRSNRLLQKNFSLPIFLQHSYMPLLCIALVIGTVMITDAIIVPLTPKYLLGSWHGRLPSGTPFYFHFLSEKDFSYRRFTDRMGLDGEYSLTIDNISGQVSIIFKVKDIYDENGEKQIPDATKSLQATILNYTYNKMYLRALSLHKETLFDILFARSWRS